MIFTSSICMGIQQGKNVLLMDQRITMYLTLSRGSRFFSQAQAILSWHKPAFATRKRGERVSPNTNNWKKAQSLRQFSSQLTRFRLPSCSNHKNQMFET